MTRGGTAAGEVRSERMVLPKAPLDRAGNEYEEDEEANPHEDGEETAPGEAASSSAPPSHPRLRGRARAPVRRPARHRVSAAALAAALLAPSAAPTSSRSHEQLSALARHLDDSELALLADALDHGRDVRIRYRNSAGNRTVRDIRPTGIYDRWLTAWCHLRSAERDFTVANIEMVVLGE